MSGAGWSALARISIQFSVIAASTVVARRVAPSAYGVVGMALLVTGLVSLFRDLGTTAAIIQKQDINDKLLSSVFWLNLAIGFVISGLCFAIAPAAGKFFRDSEIVPVLRVLSSSFVISSFASVHSALLNREMAFKKLSLIEIFSSFARIATVVTLACMNAGVWSLVSSTLVDAAVSSLLLQLATGWRPVFTFSRTEIRNLLGFGLKVSGFNFFNYFARNADNGIIGRYLGSTSLGFYELAYNIMFFPVQGIAWLLTRVLFPAFSKIQNDNEEFRRIYLQACSAIALITFPLMTGVAVLASPLIRTVYGPRWVNVISVLVILAPVGLVQSVFTTWGQICLGKGRADLYVRIGVFQGCAYIASFFAGLPWGIRGVAAGYAICNALIIPPILFINFRLIGLRFSDFLRALSPICSATLLMGVLVYGSRYAVLSRVTLTPFVDLLLWTTSGILVYTATIYVQNPPIARVVLGHIPILRDVWDYRRRRSAEILAEAAGSDQ